MAAAERAGILDKSIHKLKAMASGSKITQEQYLLLRVVWRNRSDATNIPKGKYGIEKKWDGAESCLDNNEDGQDAYRAQPKSAVDIHIDST